jgi:DegV family protein with EDD domain
VLNSSLVQEGLKKSGDWKYETSAVRKSGIKFGGIKYMSFHIVADSCCELTADMKKRENIEIAPLTLEVGGESILDDETFDQKYFLKRVAECPECPKSACPSPEYFRTAFLNGAKHCYAVTLSAQLSGSYNSAVLGANLAQEEDEDLKIHVFNSRSASIGETLIVKKIVECEEAGMSFERVVETVELYISTQHTYFVLENLETLRKNGRLSKTKALVASALKIKPVMGATSEGDIVQLDQARGINKALMKMVDAIVNDAQHVENKTLAISHCNCPERAEMVKEALLERLAVQDVFVLDTQGVSSMYANDGGIIIAL